MWCVKDTKIQFLTKMKLNELNYYDYFNKINRLNLTKIIENSLIFPYNIQTNRRMSGFNENLTEREVNSWGKEQFYYAVY